MATKNISKPKFEVRDVIRTIRKTYEFKNLLVETDIEKDAISQFNVWMAQAIAEGVKEPNAMTLATVDKKGFPKARIVLLRDFDENGFSFFTNYKSAKGKELDSHKACLNFFWIEVSRQVRIIGKADKVPVNESDMYFNSRPRESQIAAWASAQSEKISSREQLEKQFVFYQKKFEGGLVPKPPHWGGFRLKPLQIEFWQGRENRLHDRILYTRQKGGWKIERLSP